MVAFPYAGEARAVVSFVTQLLAHGAQPESVAVISFYAKQCTLLRQLLPVTDPPVAVLSVDASQGCEWHFVLVSFVRARGGAANVGFLSDDRRLNVSLTRARLGLILVGDAVHLAGAGESCALPSLARDMHDRGLLFRGVCADCPRHISVFSPSSSDNVDPADLHGSMATHDLLQQAYPPLNPVRKNHLPWSARGTPCPFPVTRAATLPHHCYITGKPTDVNDDAGLRVRKRKRQADTQLAYSAGTLHKLQKVVGAWYHTQQPFFWRRMNLINRPHPPPLRAIHKLLLERPSPPPRPTYALSPPLEPPSSNRCPPHGSPQNTISYSTVYTCTRI